MGVILVTGGGGYIGSICVSLLMERGYETICIDNFERGHEEAVLCKFFRSDLRNMDGLIDLFARYEIDAVMHFAAYCDANESVLHPAEYIHNNVVGTLNLLNAMKRFGVMNLIFSSSCSVYGIPGRLPIREDEERNPINPYGVSKRICEDIIKEYAIAYGMKAISLRYFNAAGAHPRGILGESHKPENHLIPTVLQRAKDGGEVKIYGGDYPTPDGTCIRDYIHVMDLCLSHLLSLEYLEKREEGFFDAFNTGLNRGFSVREIVQLCEEVTGKKIKTILCERRQGDPPQLVASSAKAEKELGFQPKFRDMKEIIETAWRWERERRY